MVLALLMVVGAVLWAVIGLLMLAAAARGSGPLGGGGAILLVVVWLAGLAAFVGGAVRLIRPALQSMTSDLGKGNTGSSGKKRS